MPPSPVPSSGPPPWPATLPPELVSELPGPRSRALAERLAQVESANVTCLEPIPVFWQRAAGANVWDADGNRFVDLTAAFGVATTGHGHPQVVDAIREQAGDLVHGMGDVHPPVGKVELLEALARLFPGGGPVRSILGSSGSDAVESALKTALLATGHAGLIAFEGGYHGLSLGALDATWRADFRDPFAARLPKRTRFARFGDLEDVDREAAASSTPIGAVIVEPVQGRGGERVPPTGFLRGLRELCDQRGWLLIDDEIYTGFGRTGRTWACEHDGVVPDLLCAGKGLASGMPFSACLGRAEVMDRAWPPSRGEALHTQTFLGHPLGCAAALASIAVLEREGLAARAATSGEYALDRLRTKLAGREGVVEIRGLGLMLGVEFEDPDVAQRIVARCLERGVILLPSGDRGRVVSVTPPLCIEPDALLAALDILVSCSEECLA
jgi:4-aminobutyrate aminotransferase/(S)-3-amino-2-methylpropionate transaminase